MPETLGPPIEVPPIEVPAEYRQDRSAEIRLYIVARPLRYL